MKPLPTGPASTAAADATRVARFELLSTGSACPRCGGALVPFARVHETLAAEGASPTDTLARRVAPPDPDRMMAGEGCGWVFLGAVGVAAATWFVATPPLAIAAFVFALVVFARASKARRRPIAGERHRAAMARWERLHLCTRCGATVARGDGGSFVVEELDAQVDALLRQGRMIDAVKLVRDERGLGLKEAKDRVDARQRALDEG